MQEEGSGHAASLEREACDFKAHLQKITKGVPGTGPAEPVLSKSFCNKANGWQSSHSSKLAE